MSGKVGTYKKRWRSYHTNVADYSGPVKVAFVNDLKTRRCDRNLWVDSIKFSHADSPPAPSPPAPGGTDLSWAPPALQDPQTISLGTGSTHTKLDPDRDYVVKLPDKKKVGATFLEGGRNIVIKGGHVTVPQGVTDPNDPRTRALYIKNATGKVHVEGVLIDGSGGGQSDGVAINAPKATVQLQNMRIVGLHGNETQVHADVVQPWGGVSKLRIDRLTGSSNYQGLQLAGDPTGAIVKNTNLYYEPSNLTENLRSPHLLWITDGATSCDHSALQLEEVYVVGKADRTFGQNVWPEDRGSLGCTAAVEGERASWPKLDKVSGFVEHGAPSGGDFVPAGIAGVGYVSPGYIQQP